MAAFFAVATLVSAAALAEGGRLTPVTVKQFVASFPAVKTVAARRAAAKGATIRKGQEALAAVAEAAADQEIRGEVDSAVRRHGFRDAVEWFAVARAVAVTYAHLKLSPDDEKKRRNIDKAVEKIEKNDILSAKAKRKLIEALRANAGLLVETPPPGDVEAVRPMLGAIEAMVK